MQNKTLQDKLNAIRIYLAGIWQRKRYIMVTMWSICLVSWALIMQMPNKYESSTRIYADTSNILKPLLNGLAIQTDTGEEIRITSKTLLTRDALKDIAHQTDMHINAGQDGDAGYESMLNSLKNGIVIRSSSSNLYEISYTHSDPVVAQKVVAITMKKFVDATTGQSLRDNDSATIFLNQQIEEYKARLEDAEAKLADFKRKNQLLMPHLGQGYYIEVSQLKDQIEALDLLISEQGAAIALLRKPLEMRKGENGDTNDEQSAVINTPYDARINNLKRTLDELRIRYTEKHPDVLEIESLIVSLEALQSTSQKNMLASAAAGELTPSQSTNGNIDALQTYSWGIKEAQTELSKLTTRKHALEAKLEQYQTTLDLIPDIEAEMAALTRDYQTTSLRYDQLLERRDTAELSSHADNETHSVKFKIQEPPLVPNTPNGPPRVVFYVFMFMASAGLGVALSFFASQLTPVISSPQHLQVIVGQSAVIGGIEHMEIASKRRRLRLKALVFLASTGLLTAILVALVGHDIIFGESPIMWLSKL
jgi:polysaccharide chain length determinant protein (PEP-CTERM system associated)